MKDWKELFVNRYGKQPDMTDYVKAIVDGATKDYRDAAARAYARTFVSEYGTISKNNGTVIPSEVTGDFRPDNAFFLEWERIVNPGSLKENIAYNRWAKAIEPEREAYDRLAYKKKILHNLKNAIKDRDKNTQEMMELTSRWNTFAKAKILTDTVVYTLSNKFMDIIKKDPTMRKYLPSTLVDNPGTRLSKHFYDAVKNFKENEPKDYQSFFEIPKDYRANDMYTLTIEAERDFKLRGNPEQAKKIGDSLKKKRMEMIKARNQMDLEKKREQRSKAKNKSEKQNKQTSYQRKSNDMGFQRD